MKIYRYPLTNPRQLEKTDEITGEKLKNQLAENTLDLDITIDKTALRQSRVALQLSLEDLSFFHESYILQLKRRIRELEGDLEDEEQELKKREDTFTVIKQQFLLIARILNKLSNDDDFELVLNYIKQISLEAFDEDIFQYIEFDFDKISEKKELLWIRELENEIRTGKKSQPTGEDY